MVKKVKTFKSGMFVFSAEYSDLELIASRIKATILYETVVDLPILPEKATNLHQDLIRRSIFSTAALEGNPLTEQEVGNILADPNSSALKERAEREIHNLKTAYDVVKEVGSVGSKFKLTEGLVKKLHKLITGGIEQEYNNPGNYRNHLVKVGDADHGGVYTPPKCLDDIKTLMKSYISWINSPEIQDLPVEYRAALAHFYLSLIHPFGDGNGRTARIIEALFLRLSGIKYAPIMLSNYYYRNMDDYYWAFSNAIRSRKNDVTPFLSFFLTAYVSSLNEIKDFITYFIRKHAVRDYYVFARKNKYITQRQHDLLNILLDYPKPITLKDLFDIQPFDVLYRMVSERTARRDLKKLTEEEYLILTEEGKYDLNLRVLG